MDIEENLLSLCVLCHARHHNGKEPTPNTVRQIIAAREGWPAEIIEAYCWYVQNLSKSSTRQTCVEFARARGVSRVVHPGDALLAESAEPRP